MSKLSSLKNEDGSIVIPADPDELLGLLSIRLKEASANCETAVDALTEVYEILGHFLVDHAMNTDEEFMAAWDEYRKGMN